MPVVPVQQPTGHGLANEAPSAGVSETFEDVLKRNAGTELSGAAAASEEIATTVIRSPVISSSAIRASLLLLDRSPHIGSGAGCGRRFKLTLELQCPCRPTQQAIAPAPETAAAASGANDAKNDNTRVAPILARTNIFAR
jgi:hypothetical protein